MKEIFILQPCKGIGETISEKIIEEGAKEKPRATLVRAMSISLRHLALDIVQEAPDSGENGTPTS
jgi:hypothetical protein